MYTNLGENIWTSIFPFCSWVSSGLKKMSNMLQVYAEVYFLLIFIRGKQLVGKYLLFSLASESKRDFPFRASKDDISQTPCGLRSEETPTSHPATCVEPATLGGTASLQPLILTPAPSLWAAESHAEWLLKAMPVHKPRGGCPNS